mmetsp:Transcript_4831/g.12222  ORF Transcript_4831/g.12222 Transcript_4831/m.12222 type:complete len:238 (-) Transcript_4831:538-1251(-)
MARAAAALVPRPPLAALGQVVQREQLNRRAVQRVAYGRPVVVVGSRAGRSVREARVEKRSHLRRLEDVPARAVEEREVQLHRQVDLAHVERDVLRAAQPARQRAHVLAGEAQPQRVRAEQPVGGELLQPPHLLRRVARQLHDGARRQLLLRQPRHIHGDAQPADLQAFDLVAHGAREACRLEEAVLVDRSDRQLAGERLLRQEVGERRRAQAEVALVVLVVEVFLLLLLLAQLLPRR